MPTQTRRATSKPRPKASITQWFQNWLGVKDEGAVLKGRQEDLRVRILDAVEEFGYEDDKGNIFFDFPEPVSFTDHDGKVFKYTTLKRERHLTPALPFPDPEAAEELLRKLKLWIKPADEKVIRDLQIANPYITIHVEVDIDAVDQAYFKKIISEKEYESILVEQKETFQFRPSE